MFSGVRDCECSCAYAVAYARHVSADTIVESANPNMMVFFSVVANGSLFSTKFTNSGGTAAKKTEFPVFSTVTLKS